jgi:hypothetical protein
MTDRRSLSTDSPTPSGLTGTREGAESRPREIDRGAVNHLGNRMGRTRCLVCGGPLGPELQHLGIVPGGDDHTGYAT